MKKLIALATACLVAASCGYRLRGTGSYLPSHIKRIAVPIFKNMTTRYELDLKLTQSVITEMSARAKVDIVSEGAGADAVLLGEIQTFNVNPIAFSGQAAADRYKITIVTRIVLRDLVNAKILFSNPAFVFVSEYEVPEGADFESVETQAIDKISDEYARTIVVSILEGF